MMHKNLYILVVETNNNIFIKNHPHVNFRPEMSLRIFD